MGKSGKHCSQVKLALLSFLHIDVMLGAICNMSKIQTKGSVTVMDNTKPNKHVKQTIQETN